MNQMTMNQKGPSLISKNPLISLSILAGASLALGYYLFRNRPSLSSRKDPFTAAEERMKRLIQEEKQKNRPFPKDVDLEPAYE